MALPPIPLPPFPNVPNAPGVPAVLRAVQGAPAQFTGTLTGVLAANGVDFTGQVQGLLAQASGAVSPILGSVRGVIDAAHNVSAALSSGSVTGQLLGRITGSVDAVTGVIQGAISGVVNQISGALGGLALTDSASVSAEAAEPFVWGIYDKDGAPVLTGDSVKAVEPSKEFRISSFPVENGTFNSYNKVEVPGEVRLTFFQGGSESDRSVFLGTLDNLARTLDLYSVLTPEITYTSLNITHWSYERTAANGVTLLSVDVMLTQVRDTGEAVFTQTKAADGANPVNTGPVQTQAPTTAQATSFDSSLAGAPGLP